MKPDTSIEDVLKFIMHKVQDALTSPTKPI